MYAQGKANVDRQRALTGGYSPNYDATVAKMAREGAYAASDQSMNTEAALADQIRQGKLAGLGGMTTVDQALLNSQNIRLGLGNQAMANQTNLYGQTPGWANMAGNQLNTSGRNQIETQNLENDMMKAIMENMVRSSSIPSDYQQGMGNLGSAFGLAGQAGNMFGMGGGGGNSGGGSKGNNNPNGTPTSRPGSGTTDTPSGGDYGPYPPYDDGDWQGPYPPYDDGDWQGPMPPEGDGGGTNGDGNWEEGD